MQLRYEHYHFRVQLILFIAGLVGWLLVRPLVPPWVPGRLYASVCLLLIIQFGLKRKAKPPRPARGFPVLPPSGKSS